MDKKFMAEAITLAETKMETNEGGPFGAVVVKDGVVLGRGWNRVTSTNDPTAHAEIVAIRTACQALGNFQLEGCDLYVNCEPCPMCLAAAYWAGIRKIYYGATRNDAAAIDFADERIYREICLPPEQRTMQMEQMMRRDSLAVFKLWKQKEDKILY